MIKLDEYVISDASHTSHNVKKEGERERERKGGREREQHKGWNNNKFVSQNASFMFSFTLCVSSGEELKASHKSCWVTFVFSFFRCSFWSFSCSIMLEYSHFHVFLNAVAVIDVNAVFIYGHMLMNIKYKIYIHRE